MYLHTLTTYKTNHSLSSWKKLRKLCQLLLSHSKEYQYYEFTVIKDPAEPSKLLARRNLQSLMEKIQANDANEKEIASNSSTTIDLTESLRTLL